MPFTLSHPAAVVYFKRWGLVLSALVVGSMAPDFPYFICLSTRYQFGHTLGGIFLFDIPAGLVVLWVFHHFFKRPLLSLFPVTHQQCLMPLVNSFHFFPWQRFLLIVLSLIIGAFTHIAWDSLTHESGWIVEQLPILSLPIIENSVVSIRIYNVLQQGSGLLGISLLVGWYWKWLKQAPKWPDAAIDSNSQWLILLVMGLIAVFIGGIYSFFNLAPGVDFYSFYQFIVKTVVVSIAIILVELSIFCVLWHFNRLKKWTPSMSGCE